MVRVAHPGHGMGVEFPSRTPEQRAQVGNLISFLRSAPESMLEMSVSPKALTADLNQFESAPDAGNQSPETKSQEAHSQEEELQDPLLELLRQAATMQEDDFFEELRRQRSGEPVST